MMMMMEKESTERNKEKIYLCIYEFDSNDMLKYRKHGTTNSILN